MGYNQAIATVPEGRDGLVVVVVCRSAIRAHDCLRIASEAVLQQSSELGVTVRDVRRLGVNQRRDDVTQRRERQVDLVGLLQTVSSGSSLCMQ